MDIKSIAEKLFERLGLQEQAKKFALAPPNNPLPLPKSNIIDGAVKYGNEEITRLEQIVRECEQTLSEFKSEKQKYDNWPSINQPTIDQAKRKVEKAEKTLQQTEVELREFKEENGLQRNVKNDDRQVQIIGAIVVAAIEGVINSWFFKDGVSTGLVGGFFYAFLVSFVNVAIAFWGGALGLRYLRHHNNAITRLGGAFFFVICFMACFFIVSMISLLRSNMDQLLAEKVLIGDELIFQAWNNALSHFQAFDGFSIFATFGSFLLFFVGIICAGIGLYKGYQFDDPCPGYGDRNRTLQAHQEEADDATEELNKVLADDKLKLSEIREIIREKASELSKNKMFIKQNYFDPTTEPTNFKLDEDLAKLAYETYNLLHQEMQVLVPAPSDLPPIPDIDTWPGNTFNGFTAKNLNQFNNLESIYSEIEKVEEATKDMYKG